MGVFGWQAEQYLNAFLIYLLLAYLRCIEWSEALNPMTSAQKPHDGCLMGPLLFRRCSATPLELRFPGTSRNPTNESSASRSYTSRGNAPDTLLQTTQTVAACHGNSGLTFVTMWSRKS